jgi:hypothetical protein
VKRTTAKVNFAYTLTLHHRPERKNPFAQLFFSLKSLSLGCHLPYVLRSVTQEIQVNHRIVSAFETLFVLITEKSYLNKIT